MVSRSLDGLTIDFPKNSSTSNILSTDGNEEVSCGSGTEGYRIERRRAPLWWATANWLPLLDLLARIQNVLFIFDGSIECGLVYLVIKLSIQVSRMSNPSGASGTSQESIVCCMSSPKDDETLNDKTVCLRPWIHCVFDLPNSGVSHMDDVSDMDDQYKI